MQPMTKTSSRGGTFIISLMVAALSAVGCAGIEGQPDEVRKVLEKRFVGKPLGDVVLVLGAPNATFKLGDGRSVYTWRRQTDKYRSNILIKSDERCVITMNVKVTPEIVEAVGEVDDSLGAFRVSYCAEQLGL